MTPPPNLELRVTSLEKRVIPRLRAIEQNYFAVADQIRTIGGECAAVANALDSLESLVEEIQDDQQAGRATSTAGGSSTSADLSPSAAARPNASTPDSAEDAVELPSLEVLYAWVTVHIVPLVRKTTTTGEGGGIRWCRQWWHHHDAVERFTALYLAYTAFAEAGEPLWRSTYLRDHLDPHMATLTSPQGPFHTCTPMRHSEAITELGHADLSGGKDE